MIAFSLQNIKSFQLTFSLTGSDTPTLLTRFRSFSRTALVFYGKILILDRGWYSQKSIIRKKPTKKKTKNILISSLAYEFDYTQPLIVAVRQHKVKST